MVIDQHRRALLIQRRDNHHWEPSGGILELGESIPNGVRRELREETRLVVDPLRMTGVYKNVSRGVIALVFECSALSGTLRTNREVCGFRWATPDEVPTLLTEAFAIRGGAIAIGVSLFRARRRARFSVHLYQHGFIIDEQQGATVLRYDSLLAHESRDDKGRPFYQVKTQQQPTWTILPDVQGIDELGQMVMRQARYPTP